MFWFMQGLCLLPVFLVIWSSSTFIVSYLIALLKGDVDIIFPYISDTGANPPESCVFGLMTIISAYAGTATIYARYKYVEKLSEETRVVSPLLNKTALVLGLLSCLGMCIVATFQEKTMATKIETSMETVHLSGALLFFITGVSYIVAQAVISYCAFPHGSSLSVCRARVGIATIAVLAFFPTVICSFFVKQGEMHRHTDDKDYPVHLASAVCEWIVAFSFVCFFLTYIDDFKLFNLRVHTEYEQLS